ncbi:hypothetical protein BJ878DRAFT_517375 [Calycina marina]|uniref:Uncharacterized protein n=1 Tax=Calycina marina TaxID=1763456 RepID=A0A9P7YYL5_9HELO|nr:hypothetical protein BJ878DRAFT_517375 [Calycina marina]
MMSSAPSSVGPDHSSKTTRDAVTAPSIGKAVIGSPLVRTILKVYGKEILESASEQFLDLALEVRLQTISARELGKLLAKANRLGYQETDIIVSENGAPPVQGGNVNSRSMPEAIETPKPPGAIAAATSARPLSLKKARAPNHTNKVMGRRAAPSAKEGGYSIQSIQGIAGINDEVPTAVGTAQKQGQTMTASGSRVVARIVRSRTASKRGLAQDTRVQSQRPRKLAQASAGESSLSISA